MRMLSMALAALGAVAVICRSAQSAPEQSVTIVALGASVTAGYGWSKDGAFPAVLERTLRERGHDVTVINAGVPDDGSADMLKRLDIDVPAGTRFVIYQPGANDKISKEQTHENVAKIVDALRARHIKVFMYPSSMLEMQGKTIAEQRQAVFLGGHLQEAMGGAKGSRAALPKEYFLPDGVHLNGEGHAKVAEALAKLMEPMLAASPGGGMAGSAMMRGGPGGAGPDMGQMRQKIATRLPGMDADKDGKISKAEFLEATGQMPPQKKTAVFTSFDRNGDGQITPDEIEANGVAR